MFEHVFTKYSASLRDDLKDRGPSEVCDQNVVFDPLTLANRDNSEAVKAEFGADGLNVDLFDFTWND